MALIHSLEVEGRMLFRYRGKIPIVLFILAIPIIYSTNYFQYQPATISLVNSIAVIISCIGFLTRAITIGTIPGWISEKNSESQQAYALNTTGIYSMVRHPLYLGTYLIWSGIVITTMNGLFFLIVSFGFWIYCERLMIAEERFLEHKYGNEYLNWSMNVPAFLPRFNLYKEGIEKFRLIPVLKREYVSFYAAVLGFLFVHYLINTRYREIHLSRNFIITFAISTFIALFLWLYKKIDNR